MLIPKALKELAKETRAYLVVIAAKTTKATKVKGSEVNKLAQKLQNLSIKAITRKDL